MKGNTQYLYEYRNGEKARNIGFLNMENQMNQSTIRIHAQGMDEIKGIVFQRPNGEVYLGTWEDMSAQMPQASPQNEIQEERNVENDMPEVQMEEDREDEEYIEPSNVTYEKIQRQELSRLPRREWRLANNSFLLHGFYNYHHLLYIEEDGKIWIGVPGIYHEKERMAANAFGFTEFRRLTDVSVELNEDEKNTYDDFGYWCRQIPMTRL